MGKRKKEGFTGRILLLRQEGSQTSLKKYDARILRVGQVDRKVNGISVSKVSREKFHLSSMGTDVCGSQGQHLLLVALRSQNRSAGDCLAGELLFRAGDCESRWNGQTDSAPLVVTHRETL